MKTNHTSITIKELTSNIYSVDEDGKKLDYGSAGNVDDFGVFALDGKLEVRPPYQREFVWELKKQIKFILSILKGWSINPIVLSKESKLENGIEFQAVDGQQRIITICRFINNQFEIPYDNNIKSTFAGLSIADKNKILNYVLYVTENEYDSFEEKIEHFGTINEPITILTKQELRNAAHTGPFVSALKEKFGKARCVVTTSESYLRYISKPVTENINRQALTELAIMWHLVLTDDDVYDQVSHSNNHAFNLDDMDSKINAYMRAHIDDTNCDDVWNSFLSITKWADDLLDGRVNSELKNVKNWAFLYRKYKDCSFDVDVFREKFDELDDDIEIHHKFNLVEYLLIKYTQNYSEKELDVICRTLLSLSNFPKDIKKLVWLQQGKKCLDCNNEFSIDLLEAHHIKPWSMGGKTETANCAMLCHRCHGLRHNYGRED